MSMSVPYKVGEDYSTSLRVFCYVNIEEEEEEEDEEEEYFISCNQYITCLCENLLSACSDVG